MSLLELENPEWIKGAGPDSDIVISTRARLARNLAAYPFPSHCSQDELLEIAQEVKAVSSSLLTKYPNLTNVLLDKLTNEQKYFLIDARFTSLYQVLDENGRLIILEPYGKLSIMVNEEDHIRLQSILSGLVVDRAWKTVDWADNVLGESLDFGFSDKYGYLTASVSNLGTGLRISAMMHLAGLSQTGKLKAHLRAAYDLGISIRGMLGEGSRFVGDLFQVSNEATLGISELEIVDRVHSMASFILEEEKLARKELDSEHRTQLVVRIQKSLRLLQNARSMMSERAISLLSVIRLGVSLGIINNCSIRTLNEILAGMQLGAGEDFKASMLRAQMIRDKLADVCADD